MLNLFLDYLKNAIWQYYVEIYLCRKLDFYHHLQVYGDWLRKLRVFSLLEKMHDPQQDPIVVWLWVQILT